MTTTTYAFHTPRRASTPHLSVVEPRRVTRPPLAARCGLFAAGMSPGFLLAGLASTQGGATMVLTDFALAGICAVAAFAAAARARTIQRRRIARIRTRSSEQPISQSRSIPVRRAA